MDEKEYVHPDIEVVTIRGRCYRKVKVAPPPGVLIAGFNRYDQFRNQRPKTKNDFLYTRLSHDCVYYHKEFISKELANTYYEELKHLNWQSSKKHNRKTVLYGVPGIHYHYPDQPTSSVHSWEDNKILLEIKEKVTNWYEKIFGRKCNFDVCLGNYYADGTKSIGWHADREELGRTTPIISISLGAERHFELRSKKNPDKCTRLRVHNGSLLVMENECQMLYTHRIAKNPSVKTPRINLTFRSKTDKNIQVDPSVRATFESFNEPDYDQYVVNIHKAEYDVYIGRKDYNIKGSDFKWGNPFVIDPNRGIDRDQVVDMFDKWIRKPEQYQLRMDAKKELKGKKLGCVCAPLRCHGDVLARIANDSKEASMIYKEPTYENGHSFWNNSNKSFGNNAMYEEETYPNEKEQFHVSIVDQNFVIRMPMANAFIRFIIGSGGLTMKSIQSDTNTRIDIPKLSSKDNDDPSVEVVVTIRGASKQGVVSAASRIQIVMADAELSHKMPYTHFLSIPLNSQTFKSHFAKFKTSAITLKSRGLDESIFVNSQQLHLTLCMLKLYSKDDVKKIKSLMNDLSPILNDLLLSTLPMDRENETHSVKLHLTFKGLEIMNDDPSEVDVLYLKVVQNKGLAKLKVLCKEIISHLQKEGFLSNEEVERQHLNDRVSADSRERNEKIGIKFHVTLINTKRRKNQGASINGQKGWSKQRITFDARQLLDKMKNVNFGNEPIPRLHLSHLKGIDKKSGYYACLQSINFP